MNTAKLYSDLRVAEGVRYVAYKDNRGFWTAGVGHFLDQSKDWTGMRFSDGQVQAWLAQDVSTAISESMALPEWPALNTDARQNAIVELVFNLGDEDWQKFRMTRAALEAQNWKGAHDNLLIGPWHTEVGPTRANRIANYILTGEFDANGQNKAA